MARGMNPYLGLAAGYFANRGPGSSPMQALGGGLMQMQQMANLQRQQQLSEKREQRRQEMQDQQTKALQQELARKDREEKTREKLSEYFATHSPEEKKDLVRSLSNAGHTQAAMQVAGLMPKESERISADQLRAIAAQKLSGGDPQKLLTLLDDSEADPTFGRSRVGLAENKLMELNLKMQANQPLSEREKLEYRTAYQILTTPQTITGAGGQVDVYTPGTIFQPLGGAATQPAAAQVMPEQMPAPGTPSLKTIRQPTQKKTASILKADETIAGAQTAMEQVQQAIDTLKTSSAPITGVSGMYQREVKEGILPSIQGALGVEPEVETPATAFEQQILGLQSLLRVPLTGVGNTSGTEWQMLSKRLQGLDWKDSKSSTLEALNSIMNDLSAIVDKNQQFKAQQGFTEPAAGGGEVTPEAQSIIDAVKSGQLSREEGAQQLRALGYSD
jgi:hypothetical protein